VSRAAGVGRVVAALGLALAVVGLPAAASSASNGGPPSMLNGLLVAPEQVGPPPAGSRPQLLDAIEFYSLRRPDKELVATLEIGQFRPGTHVTSAAFQQSVAGQVGTQVPLEQQLGGETVFVTASRQVDLAVWFRDTRLFVLSIRNDYDFPKALIRAALGVDT